VQADPAEASKVIREELQGGATLLDLCLDTAGCLGLDGDAAQAAGWRGRQGVMVFSPGDLAQALTGVDPTTTFLSLHAGSAFLPVAAMLAAWLQQDGGDRSACRLAFNADPLGTLLTHGTLPGPLETALGQMADLAAWTMQRLPRATSVLASGFPYHHAGASSLQDLAFTIGTAVEYLRALVEAGLDRNAAARQIRFQVAVGCQFFQGVAKVRALRRMWARALEACGADPGLVASMSLTVETSRRVLTRRDPWGNLLRNTACCFAGAVGGADAIITLPMDAAIGASDAFTRRLARNTQLILREECQLHRVADPAGGSWFLEKLTDQMAEKAWAEFQAVEKNGGMLRAAVSGWIAQQIAAVERQREKDVATIKTPITGVSQHADLFEAPIERSLPTEEALAGIASSRLAGWRRGRKAEALQAALAQLEAALSGKPGSLTAAALQAARVGASLGEMVQVLTRTGQPLHVAPLLVHPYAAAFEELRDASDAFAGAHGGRRPRIFLANMGTPREFLARATYALNFFQAGGFEPVNNDGFADAGSAASAFASSGVPIVVICSTDARYEVEVAQLAPKLKAAGARTVILAGNPGANESRYRQAGVDRFIFVKCDVLTTLRELLTEQGVLSAAPPTTSS
jgi:methylmalonyl-CoA mutase